MNSKRVTSLVVLSLMVLATGLSPTQAAPLWTQVDVLRNGADGLTSLDGVYDFVMSADGQFAYTAAYNSSAVTVFSRDQATGALSQQQVLTNNVGGVGGIGATRALRLSPDGEFLYAAGTTDNAIAIFDRNTANGQLTFLSSYTNGGALNGLSAANALNISHDGKFVYASSETNHSLSTFARDAISGTLTFVETLKDGVAPISTLNTIRSFTISDDDRFLYAPARDDNDLTQFARDPLTGKLTVAQALTGSPNFNGPTHISFSADGLHAYVSSQFGDSLSLFDVDSLSGNLSHKTTYFDNAGGFHYLDHAEDIVVTADDQFVIVTATIDNALSIYLRDPITGELTVHQEFRDGVAGIDGLFRARELYLSPDQNFLYVMSAEEHTISIFAVPEPATRWLAGIGMIGVVLAAARLRMKRAK
jgi:6-phosphogluconolactonase (cycloisomerase 2 family)